MSEPAPNPWLDDGAADDLTVVGGGRGRIAQDTGVPRNGAPRSAYTAMPGPDVPQPTAAVPAAETALPIIRQTSTPAWWWVGAHGGAGETTLATLIPSGAEAGHGWPTGPGDLHPPAVVVARSSYTGLIAAQNAVRQWATGAVPVQLLGLVIMPDIPGALPRPLRDLTRLIAGGFPRSWVMPWIPACRMGPVHTENRSSRINSLATDLRALAAAPLPVAQFAKEG